MAEINNQKKEHCTLCYLSLVLPIIDLFRMYVSIGGTLPIFSFVGMILGGMGLFQTLKNKNLKGKWFGVVGFIICTTIAITTILALILNPCIFTSAVCP